MRTQEVIWIYLTLVFFPLKIERYQGILCYSKNAGAVHIVFMDSFLNSSLNTMP